MAKMSEGPSITDVRPRPCCMCGATVQIRSSTTSHSEAPEMLQPPAGAWIGFIRGDHAPEMIVVCSARQVAARRRAGSAPLRLDGQA
jgi:hypothetical protein